MVTVWQRFRQTIHKRRYNNTPLYFTAGHSGRFVGAKLVVCGLQISKKKIGRRPQIWNLDWQKFRNFEKLMLAFFYIWSHINPFDP